MVILSVIATISEASAQFELEERRPLQASLRCEIQRKDNKMSLTDGLIYGDFTKT